MPVGSGDHRLAFNHCDDVGGFIGHLQNAVVAMELIEGDVENALHYVGLAKFEKFKRKKVDLIPCVTRRER